MFQNIDQKKKELDNYLPLPTRIAENLRENVYLNWIYNSNAIEGNTLTLIETKVVLEGITIGGKTLGEHLEIVNHRDAILYIEEIVRNNEEFSVWLIKNIHQLILKSIDDKYAGVYRDIQVMISGAVHRPPAPYLVKEEMDDFINWYKEEGIKLHPVERAALVHIIFVGIHPFIDGNGRTSRLLLNLELMKNGYPPIVIKNDKKLEYYKALDIAHTTKNYLPFIEIVKEEVEEMLDFYLEFIRG